jgi:isopenicillin-N N-acyltransferase like protein
MANPYAPSRNVLARTAAGFTLLLVFLLALPVTSGACTLWAATGSRVSRGDTLIAKNRDNLSGFSTELRFVSREKGFRFVALFDPEADGYVVSGINEKGLTVVNASATTLPPEKRNVAKEDLTERILASFSSVDEVAREEEMFAESHPAFYMIADTGKIAMVEVAPGGKISIKVTGNGLLTHTNHYRDGKLLEANERPAGGSRKRLTRIDHLLGSARRPLSFDRFIAMTEDRKGLGGESIRQACGETKNVCTLATWVALLPREGSPEIYVKIEGKDQREKVRKFTLDALFWEQASKTVNP